VNSFVTDDKWQKQMRDEYLVPWYKKHATDGRFVLLDKGRFSETVQRRLAADTIVQSEDGNAVAIEEKIVRWKGRTYTAICAETNSCTLPGLESPGWTQYGQFDYLMYCLQTEPGDLYAMIIRGPEFLAWFNQRVESFPVFQMSTQNKTTGRLVPIDQLSESKLITWRGLITKSQ
jgi:hypothetical protein|tara:strand:+ start:1196 stop:1720 length:525 start_codon:yes stop_codon:yes gene_type:complete